MDKNLLKNFATESKIELTKKIETKIRNLLINEKFEETQTGDIYYLKNNLHSLSLSSQDYQKRKLLIERISKLGLNLVIEEATFTWFNRIIALRYMEIHDYLPLTKNNESLGIRVLSSRDNTPIPEIMKFTNLINPELDIGFKKEKYVELKDDNEKFKYILLLVCQKLGKVIPQVFGGTTDYIDILIPDYLLNETGFINKLVTEIPESNYEQVEIIGWLYQYYNQIEKDKAMSKKRTYSKNEISYVTQLFTPDWIVKYLVENSLGRYYIEHNSSCYSSIGDKFKYLIKENIDFQNKNINIEKITFFDPCCGSGHILVYAFEIFFEIYKFEGYNVKDIAALILKNNLYGLDIDERASQLTILSLLLKAREYDKKIFSNEITMNLNIMSLQESGNKDNNFINELSEINRENAQYLINVFENAKEIGSLLKLKPNNYSSLQEEIMNNTSIFGITLQKKLIPLITQAKILTQKYTIVVTNPPYLNASVMPQNLKKYLAQYYNDSKTDLCTAFMELECVSTDGYLAMINQHSWMFLSSFERLRNKIIFNKNILNMIHLGTRAFEEIGGEVVQTTAFIMNQSKSQNKSLFIRLVDVKSAIEKEKAFFEIIANKKYYLTEISKFSVIPGKPFAYWVNETILKIFENSYELGNIVPIKQGIATADNNRFLRLWYEVDKNKEKLISKSVNDAKNSNFKWYPYNKGGPFRKWYGNNDYVVNWENDGFEIKNFKDDKGKLRSRPQNLEFCFQKSISWSLISSGSIAFRYKPFGHIFDIAGMSCFPSENIFNYILGLNNTKIVNNIMKFIAPTLNYQVGDIAKIPIIKNENFKDKISCLVNQNIEISKEDWDSFETSWDFTTHPLIEYIENIDYIDDLKGCNYTIKDAFESWKLNCNEKFKLLKNNEEELNRIFIEIYGLNDELTPEVDPKDITIRKADKLREIKSLISYAVGCMFGRYSLDENGLIYAGGKFDETKYKKFEVDSDNIIPITDETYFDDDIVQRFKKFIEVAFGKDTLNENLDFIAEILGKKGTETSEETIRRYFVNDFFNDHCKIYQKRPIYWLLDSGKKNGFKALIYMHRYSENLIPKTRLDYLHRIQTTYEKILSDVNYKLTTDLSMIDKKEALKKQADLNAKLQEIKEYDEKIAHIANQRIEIDLDDGVKVNYEKFNEILAKIK